MAITDGNFTSEELSAAIQANPELVKNVIPALSGYTVRSADEETQFKTNYENEVASRLTKTQAERAEKFIKETTGIDKIAPDEKWYEYSERAMKLLTDERNTLKGKGGDTADVDKRIKAIEDSYKTKLTGNETTIKELNSTVQRLKIENSIQGTLASMKFLPTLPESVKNREIKAAIDGLITSGELQTDGTMIFNDEEGNPIMNNQTHKPKTAAEILPDRLKDILDAGKTATGAGVGTDAAKDAASDAKDFKGFPAEVTTRVEANDYLKKIGIASGTKEYLEIFKTDAYKKLPLQ